MKNVILFGLVVLLVWGGTVVGLPSEAEAEAGYRLCQRYDEEDRETYYMKRDANIPMMGSPYKGRTCAKSPHGDWANVPHYNEIDLSVCEDFTLHILGTLIPDDVCPLMDDLDLKMNAQYTKNDLLLLLGKDIPRTGGETDNTTAICMHDYDNELNINTSTWILIDHEVYKRAGCQAFSLSGAPMRSVRFVFAASCADEDDFYVELCKAKKTWVITTKDLDRLDSGKTVTQMAKYGSIYWVSGVPNYYEVYGYNYP